MATTTYDGIVPSTSNELVPNTLQAGHFSTRTVINPVGLPAGSYLIATWITAPGQADGVVQDAVDVAGNEFTRRSVAFPNVWSPFQPGGGGGGVTSWQGAVGAPRVGAVVAAIGDYTSTMVTNNSVVPGADVTAALNALSASSGVSSFNARVGAVLPVAGDYTSTDITNLSGVAGADVTAALNTLDANKVSLGNATGAQDLLVATAAGDNYAPSGTTLPGRIGALLAGQNGGVTQTPLGAVIEAVGDGAVPANGLIRASKGAAASVAPNYSVILADVSADPLFGQAGNAQSCIRATMPALPAATGLAGAYAFSLDVALGGKVFFVNALGNVHVTLAAGPAASALGVNGAGLLCLFP